MIDVNDTIIDLMKTNVVTEHVTIKTSLNTKNILRFDGSLF